MKEVVVARNISDSTKKSILCNVWIYITPLAVLAIVLLLTTPFWYRYGWVSEGGVKKELDFFKKALVITTNKFYLQLNDAYKTGNEELFNSLAELLKVAYKQEHTMQEDTIQELKRISKVIDSFSHVQDDEFAKMKGQIFNLINSDIRNDKIFRCIDSIESYMAKFGKKWEADWQLVLNEARSSSMEVRKLDERVWQAGMRSESQVQKILDTVQQVRLDMQGINARFEYFDKNLKDVAKKVNKFEKSVQHKVGSALNDVERIKRKSRFKV